MIYRDQLDLLSIYGISSIQNVIFYNGCFYILANKRDGKLGYYLLKLRQDTPHNIDAARIDDAFILNVNNKLDIASVDMHVFTDEVTDQRQLLISYKTIFINVYTINVIDLDNDTDINGNLMYRHESFCLWETAIVSIMNKITRDLVILSNEGLGVMDLSSNVVTREVTANDD